MSLVSTVGRLVTRRHQRLVPAYLLAMIVGIVGMHALMQHCPAPAHTMAASSSEMTTTHHAGEHMAAVGQLPVAAVQPTGQTGGSLNDMLMLCAAMLLGAGALLTLLLRRRFSRPTLLARPSQSDWRPPTLVLAGIGPPPTLAFTVIRC
jgi:hypothetical protein